MKKGRQGRILELIAERPIETQEELSELLRKEGYSAAQATISRDIKSLRLLKATDGEGRQHYIAPPERAVKDREKLLRVLREGLSGMDTAGHLLVLRTLPGMANAVAMAIDEHPFERLVGTLAGDDTILCAMKTEGDAEKLKRELRKLSS